MTFMVLLPSLSKADGLWTDSENGVIYNYKDDGTASVSRSKGASGDLVIRDSIKVGEK